MTELKTSPPEIVEVKVSNGIYAKYIKRFLDICCALAAIIVFSWLYIIIAILVRIKLGSPIIFKQERPGKDEKIFKLYKFRTMTDEKNENGELLPDKKRLTKFGRFLRSTSLDELPEAFNILKGDMSVIGPRPQLVRDMVFMSDRHRMRHKVRPGLSGLAQISGRNAIDWQNKLDLDLEYIQQIAFFYDWKIIFLTVFKVFKREDISAEGMETAEDYGDYLLRNGNISQGEYDTLQDEAKKLSAVG